MLCTVYTRINISFNNNKFIRCCPFQRPFRTGTNFHLNPRIYRRSRPSRLPSTPQLKSSLHTHGNKLRVYIVQKHFIVYILERRLSCPNLTVVKITFQYWISDLYQKDEDEMILIDSDSGVNSIQYTSNALKL